MNTATEEKLVTAIVTMLLAAITKYGVPEAQSLLLSALEAVGDIPYLDAIVNIFDGKTEADRDQLLIGIPGVCLPLAQDAQECHTAEGWRDRDCDKVPDKEDACPDQGDAGCGVTPDGCPVSCK